MNIHRFVDDLREMCRAVHNGVPPTEAYAQRVAQLLLMTAAHESDGFRARRQYGFSNESHRGAFSLFQMEVDSIRRSLDDLANKPTLRQSVEMWLIVSDDIAIPAGIGGDELDYVLGRIQRPEGDRWAMVLARLHYLRVPAPVPSSAREMAEYAKRYWNTAAGKATPLDYAAKAVEYLWGAA